jgi:regulatory protein
VSRFARRGGTPADPELRSAELAKRALASATRALARRPRSRAELAALLRRRGYAEQAIAAALERLEAQGLLDDAAVAGAVGRQAAARRLGSRRVKQILAQRGVREGDARTAEEESRAADLERARALLERRFPAGVGRAPAERARAARLLARRGFPGGVVRQALGIDVDLGADEIDHVDEADGAFPSGDVPEGGEPGSAGSRGRV